MPFKNRIEAGKLLASQIKEAKIDDPIIIALPRGGVPVGYEVAKKLKSPLDILVVRKVGAPNNPEYGIGAITEEGYYWINQEAATGAGTTRADIDLTLEFEKKEVSRRIQEYRSNRQRVDVKGRNVILVDDGLATGVTARVASSFLKQVGAREVILAIPVCAADTAEQFRSEGRTVICLEESDYFFSVGQFYQDFSQVLDEEVLSLLNKVHEKPKKGSFSKEVIISTESVQLLGLYTLPHNSKGIVIFVHGSGSSRLSPRNLEVAKSLNKAGLGTLLFDLLTLEESANRKLVFNIPLLASRLLSATQYVQSMNQGKDLPIGYFGASTGAAAALWAAADLKDQVVAVVSRGGRPDLIRSRLTDVIAPTLLIVGGADDEVLKLNHSVLPYLRHADLYIIPDATHLFEEPGALEQVAQHAAQWFGYYFDKNNQSKTPKKDIDQAA